MKSYISQLYNGKMLVLEDDIIRVEDTGYPLPDCVLEVGKTIKGQDKILRAILGYTPEDMKSFISYNLELDELPLKEWKVKMQSENVGGACPSNLIRYANYIISGRTHLEAMYLLILNEDLIKEDFILPTEEYLEDHKQFLNGSLSPRFVVSSALQMPFLYFKNISVNLLNEGCIIFLKELIRDIGNEYVNSLFNNITMVMGKNGKGWFILCKSAEFNEDLQFFFSKLLNLSFGDCQINCDIEDNNVTIYANSLDDYNEVFFEVLPKFRGSFKRYSLED